MTNAFTRTVVLLVFIFISCQNKKTTSKNTGAQSKNTAVAGKPHFDYTFEIPEGWTTRDTVMKDGMKIRLISAPQSLAADNPSGNVLIASMNGDNIDDFTTKNINYLEKNMAGVTILTRGNIDSSVYQGKWFRYIKEHNGTVRDMISYLVPVKGFAYIITCGSNKGSFDTYRPVFDKIAWSFKG
jgi:hypothetical protein